MSVSGSVTLFQNINGYKVVCAHIADEQNKQKLVNLSTLKQEGPF